MSGKCNIVERSVEYILVDLMTKKVMSIGIQASSIGGLQASPSTRQHFDCTVEKRIKHHNDIDNVK